ncbi:helix-turn-helix domain-containing protein [Companilactobacillus futsaii]|uniref:Helix-turn-helix transcriptional regulator n=2 Tax=Companilactobacillus futsaii TaxID=938155 RepID=A0A5B7T6K0_9LACO|nr:helix-turn-helix transcriptional regulator [Companilactobacillus futsaii]QCX25821.1 helix-turn-helix transcriptional regulator [Companilactobacillus futsaii]
MDINIFIERRKELKMSQVKLCQGICTQSTLSKFENNGRVPSLAILNKLCERLGLSVDDLYKNSSASTTHMRTVLSRIESDLMMGSYDKVSEALKDLKIDDVNNNELKMQFYYQKGLFITLTNGKFEELFYNFSQILDNLDEKHQTIYSYLSYVGLGIFYSRINKMEQAEFYFEKVLEYINLHKDQTYQKSSLNVYLRILTIVFYTADFLIVKNDFETSLELVQRGIRLCSEQHITYYLPRLKLLEAKIAIGRNQSPTDVKDLLTDAMAFAKINHNEVVELRINALRKQYQDMKRNGNE